MDVAATLASLRNVRSSTILSNHEQKLLKIRYRYIRLIYSKGWQVYAVRSFCQSFYLNVLSAAIK